MKKLVSLLLTFVMVMSIFAISCTSISAWTIRTSLPNSKDSGWKYYSSPLNTFSVSPHNKGNCTWYAFGRAYEVFGKDPALRSAGDAGKWYSYAKNNGFSVGSTPKAGSIICWSTHVAFVESVSGSTITWTESNYQYPDDPYKTPFKKYSSTHPETYCSEGGGVLQGYIYLDNTTTHTHSYDTYVYNWDAHPHYKCYKCSCGEVKENRNEKVLFDTCAACLADYKATLTTDKSKFGIGESVTIKWNSIPGATHYNLWLYRRNEDGTSKLVSRNDLIKDTMFTFSNLAEGKYYTYFATYNSNVWKQNHSDWFYSVADVIEFEVSKKAYPGEPKLKVISGSSEDHIWFTWGTTTNTNHYTLHLYNVDNDYKYPLITYIDGLNYYLKLPAGNYTAQLASINENLRGTDRWYTMSNIVEFAVTKGELSPLGCVKYGGKTYEIYDNSMSWQEAKVLCEDLGGHLVTVTSQEEMDKIKEILPYGSRRAYWMGLTDFDKDLTWETVTGENSSYAYWAKNQPDYFENNEDCAVIQNEDDYKWNDVPDDCVLYYHVGFICEYEMEDPDMMDGDVDGDRKVTIKDATAIQKHVANLIIIDEDKFSCADTDKDKKITIKDATLIQKFVADIIPQL